MIKCGFNAMTRTVLVADDNLTIQRMASEMLSQEGMEVVTVANGMAAIKKLPDLKPLVVVADVDMPGKDGYEVCQFVKNHSDLGYVRVLLVVSDTDPFDATRGAQVRADGIIKKPFDRQQLVSIVMKSIEEAQAMCPPPPAVEAAEANDIGPWALDHSALQTEVEYRHPASDSTALSGPNEPLPSFPSAIFAEPGPAEPVGILPEAPDPHIVEWPAGPSPAIAQEYHDLPAASPEPSDPPIVDWPAAPSSAIAGGNPEPSISNSEPALAADPDSVLSDFPAPPSGWNEEAVLQPVALPDSEAPEVFKASSSEEQPVPEMTLTEPFTGAGPSLDLMPPGSADGVTAPVESGEESLNAIPAVDVSLVASVIHAVVARMAPPVLSPESIYNIEQKLTDEIIPELTSKLSPV